MMHRNITLRVPVDLIERLDAEVVAEAARTGLRIDRSQIIRRVLSQALPAGQKPSVKKAAR